MAAVAGQLTTFNMPNYLGELFNVTPRETPFLSMIGGLNGGKGIMDTQWSWQSQDNADAAQDTKLEGADATFSGRSRAMVNNALQIHQEGVEITYTHMAALNKLADATSTAISQSALLSIEGMQPVRNPMSNQLRLKIEKVARDVEFSFIQGTYSHELDVNDTERQTRGILAAITTNEVVAAAAQLDRGMLNELLREMAGDTTRGAPFRNAVIMCGAYNKQKLSEIYGYAPESRTVGGLNISQIETDFATLGVVFNRFMPPDDLVVVELSVCRPAHMIIPGKGLFFTEPLAKTGSAEKMQLYGEIGLEYGIEDWHGKITGTAVAPA